MYSEIICVNYSRSYFVYLSSRLGFSLICKCSAKVQIKKAKNKSVGGRDLLFALFCYIADGACHPMLLTALRVAARHTRQTAILVSHLLLATVRALAL